MTRSVLVTGGASGIGRAAAVLLAREGAAVTVVDRAASAAEDTTREITSAGGSAHAAPGDGGDEGEMVAPGSQPVSAVRRDRRAGGRRAVFPRGGLHSAVAG